MKEDYFDYLLQRVHDIRSCERSAMAKIGDVIALSMDYDRGKLPLQLRKLRELLKFHDFAERFANYLLLVVEVRAKIKSAWTMSDIDQMVVDFVIRYLIARTPEDSLIFNYTCYNGQTFPGPFGVEGEVLDYFIGLPPELQSYHHNYAVLRVIGMNRLIETCSSTRTGYGYSRPYDILAKLDHKVLDGMPGGEFEAKPVIFPDGSEKGFVFEFSHFEVDMQEPDPDYRTLYVVYRYDTILS